MNRYEEMKRRQQEAVNALPIKFAFSDEQFKVAMAELGLKPKDTKKVCSVGYGGFCKVEDAKKIAQTFTDNANELREAIAADKTGDGFIYEMFLYELRNHEYGYTGSHDDTLDALGYSYAQIEKDERLKRGLEKACKTIQREEW